MPKKQLGIAKNQTLDDVRNSIILQLVELGYSLSDIEYMIRINKASASRIVRFGKNIYSKPVSAT